MVIIGRSCFGGRVNFGGQGRSDEGTLRRVRCWCFVESFCGRYCRAYFWGWNLFVGGRVLVLIRSRLPIFMRGYVGADRLVLC